MFNGSVGRGSSKCRSRRLLGTVRMEPGGGRARKPAAPRADVAVSLGIASRFDDPMMSAQRVALGARRRQSAPCMRKISSVMVFAGIPKNGSSTSSAPTPKDTTPTARAEQPPDNTRAPERTTVRAARTSMRLPAACSARSEADAAPATRVAREPRREQASAFARSRECAVRLCAS